MGMDADTVRGSYEALNRGDVEAAINALDEEAEWHESEALPDTGVYRGTRGDPRLPARLPRILAKLQQEVEDAREAHGRVCALIHLKARGRGSQAEVDARYAHLWTMREGLGVRVDAYYERADALAALEADPEGRKASEP